MKYFLVSAALLVTLARAQSSFSGCGVSDYYNGLNSGADRDTLRSFLADLLFDTHRGVWPGTNPEDPGVGDTWGALMDLDPGSFPGKVKLLYSQEEVDAVPFGGGISGWSKQRLFPPSRGLGTSGVDANDLHNMRPVDYISELVREDKYFGECGVLTKVDTCIEPAEGGAEGSCTCNRIYTPPPEIRGDIARALMYMDVRYDGRDENTLDLRLTDCPFQHDRDMAYLSQMLTWHNEDPVDDAERARNDKVCGIWQGNRNPFVDFPELAEVVHGQPLPLPPIGGRQIYEACESIPTEAPTTAPNQCELLEPGDVSIWLINSLDPDSIGLFAFEDMDPGFKLFMTTNPWDGNSFVEQGGTISLEMPSDGVDGGTPFGYGDAALQFSSSWSVESGTFSLSTSGQPIFVYCFDNFDRPKPILGFLYGDASWITSVNSTIPVGQSVRPESLGTQGIIKVAPGFSNAVFDAEVQGGNTDTLKFIVRNPNNWKASNTDRFGPPGAALMLNTFVILGICIMSAFLLL